MQAGAEPAPGAFEALRAGLGVQGAQAAPERRGLAALRVGEGHAPAGLQQGHQARQVQFRGGGRLQPQGREFRPPMRARGPPAAGPGSRSRLPLGAAPAPAGRGHAGLVGQGMLDDPAVVDDDDVGESLGS